MENYSFTWFGKKESKEYSQRVSFSTLKPCPEESVGKDGKDGVFDSQNLYIEGDNLEVLKVLERSYAGKIKMIYIDPPYNTGNDFIYNDDFHGEKVSSDDAGKHTKWLNMMYSRLMLARELLSDDGVVFISIDDNEMANLNEICNLVFGSNNYIAQLIWKSKSGGANDSRFFAVDHEYVVCVSKNSNNLHPFMDQEGEVTTNYNYIDENGEYALERLDKQSLGYQETLDFPITGPDGKIYVVEHKNQNAKVARWRWGIETVKERYNELVFKNGYVYTKNYKKDDTIARSIMFDERYGRTRTGKTDCTSLFGMNIFDNPKPIKLLQYLINISTDGENIILDFFSGSASTAHSIMKHNYDNKSKSKYIMVQIPEPCDPKTSSGKAALEAGFKNIAEIGKERIRLAGRAIKKDHPEANIDIGFKVFKLDSSNLKKWDEPANSAQEVAIQLLGQGMVVPCRSKLDAVYEYMLKYGLTIDKQVDCLKINDIDVFIVGNGIFTMCFDSWITFSWVNIFVEYIKQNFTNAISGIYILFSKNCFRCTEDITSIVSYLHKNGLQENHFILV